MNVLPADIDQGDVRCAAFVLRESLSSFPDGTVFCVVVDPGVGSYFDLESGELDINTKEAAK